MRGSNPDLSTEVTFGGLMQYPNGYVPMVAETNTGRMSPVRGRTIKENQNQIGELRKENFDLKWRIYFLEESQQNFGDKDVFETNIHLKMKIESLKKEIEQKIEMLEKSWEAQNNLTPMTSMQTPKTKLNFSSSEKSYDTDTDSESYQSAMSVVERPKRKQKISERRKRSSDVIRHFPKGLYFDGKSNWETFKEKFKKCALVLEWTPDECLTGLCWSLTDKAADFYAVITDRDKLSYQQLMKKLENRFGARELPATAQARFQQATQNTGESLEDWADRIVTLATRAFRELPESYANQQAVVRFCQGLLDKEVASQVSIKEPASMEDAINKVRWGQHVQQAVFGKKKERNRKSDSDDDDLYMVSEIVSTKQSAANLQRSGNAYPSQGSMEQLIENLRQEMNKKFESVKSTITSSSFQGRGRGRRYAPADLECFVCGELGHYARDCDKKVGGNKSGQTNKQQLND